MAIYGYTKNYKLIKPQFNTDTWHDYIYDNLDTIDAVMSAIYSSGNWKGFWAKNTTYSAGDVIIDQDTDTMYKVMVGHVTSANTFAEEQTAHPDYYELWSPNDLAESWATKTDGKISDTDYSSKAYAISSGLIDEGSAKEWAVKPGKIGNTNEYSAKKYATDAHNDYISMTTNPNVAAVGSNINNVNAVGQSISNVNTVASNVSSVNTVGNNISSVNTAASNMAAIHAAPTAATNASDSANNSHIWAEGTDAQVAALGGVHSSKGWAEQSTNANISLTNTPYTTNRILEIPQNIKLELNDGTLTLKAGSKVYVPNGTGVFDEVVISADKTLGKIGSYTGSSLLFVRADGSAIVQSVVHMSGSTAPTTSSGMWYDTTNNKIFSYTNGTVDTVQYSLPVALVARTNGSWTSIDQVFNGFGYIGSTVFALPGVKGLIPNGRNADGSLKNIEARTDSVITYTNINKGNRWYSFKSPVNGIWTAIDYKTDNNLSIGTQSKGWFFDENANYWMFNGNKSYNWLDFAHSNIGTDRPFAITSFTPRNVDSVVNSNEFYQLKDKTVTTDTEQTISAPKAFNTELVRKSRVIDITTQPENYTPNNAFKFIDKNDKVMGYIENSQQVNGQVTTAIHARNKDNYQQSIGVFVPQSGTTGGYATAPTPPANSAGGEIVTVRWFNSKMQVVSALPANPDPNVFYFIPE